MSNVLIQQLQLLWTRLGKLPGVGMTKRAGKKVKFRDQEYAQRDRHNMWLSAPKKKFKTFEPVLDRGDRHYCYVKKVTAKDYGGPVYNFQTRSETYCVANIAVHNCGLAPVAAMRCKKCQSVVIPEAGVSGMYVHTKNVSTFKKGPPKPVDENKPARPERVQPGCTPGARIHETLAFASGQAMRPVKGEKLRYNSWLRTKLVGVLGPVLIKCDSPWRKEYDTYKHRKSTAGWGRSDAHRHQAAIRYMVKMMILQIWKDYRTFYGLPVREAYAVEFQGKARHVGGTSNNNRLVSAEDDFDPEVDAELAIAMGDG